MFRGNHPAKVDEKGRLKLPAAFKALVDAASVTQFYVTSVDGESAQVWPLPEWEKREAELGVASGLEPVVKKYLAVTSYYGQQVEMDAQARISFRRFCGRKPASMTKKRWCWGLGNSWNCTTASGMRPRPTPTN